MEKEVSKLLKSHHSGISTSLSERLISSHPDYPSIVCVADTLERLNIEFVVGKKDKDNIEEIPRPFLLHAEPHHLIYVDSQTNLEETYKDYQNISGVIIKTETEKAHKNTFFSDPESFQTKIYGLILATIFFGVVGVVLLSSELNLVQGILAMASFIGLISSAVLKSREFGIANKSIERFCKSGDNSDCDAVLESSGSKIFRLFKLTDLSLCYFSIHFFSLLFINHDGIGLDYLFPFLSILTIPIIAYSIIYQWLVVKQWCKFCLVIALILSIQLFVNGYYSLTSGHLLASSNETYFYVFFIFLAILSILSYISDHNEQLIELSESNMYHKRVFDNPDLFLNQLLLQPKLDSQTPKLDIILGSKQSKITITLFINLLCKPCKESFTHLLEILDLYKSDISAIIRISGPPSVEHSHRPDSYLLDYWFTHIQGKPNESEKSIELLKDWFEILNVSSFKKKYSVDNPDVARRISMLSANEEWMIENNIHQTPTYLLNGHLIPNAYRLKELKSIIFFILKEYSKYEKLL